MVEGVGAEYDADPERARGLWSVWNTPSGAA